MSPPVREDGGQPVKSFRGTKKLAENLLFWQTSGILKKIAKNQFDEDFLILRKGDTVPQGFTFPVSTK